jgi:hypothetical protein
VLGSSSEGHVGAGKGHGLGLCRAGVACRAGPGGRRRPSLETSGSHSTDIAATLGITERTAFGIVTDLTEAGYVEKGKDGRRNRYHIQNHLPLPEAIGREQTIGEVLGLLIDTTQPSDPSAITETETPTAPGVPTHRDKRAVSRAGRRERIGRN